jgi:hypothetical protein
MQTKNIAPEKMYLVEEFYAAQKSNSDYVAFLDELRATGRTISAEMLEWAEILFRRVLEAKIAIDNLP